MGMAEGRYFRRYLQIYHLGRQGPLHYPVSFLVAVVVRPAVLFHFLKGQGETDLTVHKQYYPELGNSSAQMR